MDAPPKDGDTATKPVAIEKMEGDIIMVSTIQAPPDIPANKGRACPQCGRRAWKRSQLCWYCGYDFTCGKPVSRRLLVAACMILAASLINAIIYCATKSKQ